MSGLPLARAAVERLLGAATVKVSSARSAKTASTHLNTCCVRFAAPASACTIGRLADVSPSRSTSAGFSVEGYYDLGEQDGPTSDLLGPDFVFAKSTPAPWSWS